MIPNDFGHHTIKLLSLPGDTTLHTFIIFKNCLYTYSRTTCYLLTQPESLIITDDQLTIHQFMMKIYAYIFGNMKYTDNIYENNNPLQTILS